MKDKYETMEHSAHTAYIQWLTVSDLACAPSKIVLGFRLTTNGTLLASTASSTIAELEFLMFVTSLFEIEDNR